MPKLLCNGEAWQATVIKNGTTHLIRFLKRTGVKLAEPKAKRPRVPGRWRDQGSDERRGDTP